MLTVGDPFPEFHTQACFGNDAKSDLRPINDRTDEGMWKVFVFYPKDFTFVCPTELVEFGRQINEFKDRDAVVYGASTDNEFAHLAWRQSHEDLHSLPYPLIAAQKLANELGIVHPKEGVALRATYIVDPHGIVQFAACNNLNCGRSVKEVLRVLDAIQSDELCPCNWEKGQETLSVGAE
ncbi:MAG: peroxiredoxin [Phycisphaeraceae bacterium]